MVRRETLTLSASTIAPGVGRSIPVTVTSSAVAGQGGISVTLSGLKPAVAERPASVTIPARRSSATFNVTRRRIGHTGITANAPGHSSTSATVTVRQNAIILPASVLVPPGGSVAFPVTLSDPAPAGGLVVNLETVNGAIGTVDAMVTIPTGATSADATARGVADGTTTIEASAANYASDTTVLVVKTVTMRFDPSGTIAVASGMPTTRRVLLSDVAPPGGIRVTLDVDDDALAFVSPTSVVVPEGQLDSPSFQITGTTQGSTTLRASATGVTPTSARLNVGPPPDLTVNGNAATVGAGLHRDFSISLNTPAPTGGLTVNLASSNPDAATVPASVNVPAGQSSRSFRVTGQAPGTTTITAAAPGWSDGAATVNVATPTLVLNGVQTAGSRPPGRPRRRPTGSTLPAHAELWGMRLLQRRHADHLHRQQRHARDRDRQSLAGDGPARRLLHRQRVRQHSDDDRHLHDHRVGAGLHQRHLPDRDRDVTVGPLVSTRTGAPRLAGAASLSLGRGDAG